MNTLALWVQILTQVLTAGTAVVMAILAYRTYLQAPEQEPEAEPEAASDEEADEELTEVLVFKTSNQKTYLQIADQRIVCRIEDTRPGKGGLQWAISKEQARSILAAKAYSINPGYKVRTGAFTIGPRRNWLYTKALFPEPHYLEAVLVSLLERVANR